MGNNASPKNVLYCLFLVPFFWAEGNYLEPDEQYGSDRLESLRKSINRAYQSKN